MLCPPSAIADRWSRRFADPVPAVCSGWMRVRARARQSGAELPLIISDHADWAELCQTVKDVGAFRAAILGGEVLWSDVAVSGAAALAMLIAGCLYFRKVEDSFADII